MNGFWPIYSLGEKNSNYNGFVFLGQKPLNPGFKTYFETKKGRMIVFLCFQLYGRFLTAMTITTVAIAIATMIAIAAIVRYIITGSCVDAD